ncbi:MAG: SPOR domain-containing protein [Betaproteobacteria bacterium]|nr:SPOR domain-containing protein [Betaproteobacteria bacterium]
MTRDYRGKTRQRKATPGRSGGGTLLGVFIGLILGLGIAAGVFYYISRSPSPFQAAPASAPKNGPARPDAGGPAANAGAEKPRFDFYKILPGADEARSPSGERRSSETKPAETKVADPDKPTEGKLPKPALAKPGEQFFLQVGSFANPADAENEKARLALLGFEASIQTATLVDKGQRHRVRLGPFNSAEEMNRNKAELARRGVEATVIKNP